MTDISDKGEATYSPRARKRHSATTAITLRSSNISSSVEMAPFCDADVASIHSAQEDILPKVHVLRRSQQHKGEYTDSTMFSVVSHSAAPSSSSAECRGHRRESDVRFPRSHRHHRRTSQLFRFLVNGRPKKKKQMPETQLRKQLKKLCDRADWARVRNLISNYDFTESSDVIKEGSSSKESSSNGFEQPPFSISQDRRPSYGSTGKESAAAAAAIKAAMLEEGSDSDAEGENILHDLCRYCPPKDIVELLLVSLRHRRGCTLGTDEKRRTPLHVAAACGASPGVIEALARVDPTPASMGDIDKRTPLHLAVRFLAYQQQHSSYMAKNGDGWASRIVARRHPFGLKHSVRESSSREEAITAARQTVLILKSAMLNNPGWIDFKDEDNLGFSPLDYAIDGAIDDQRLIYSLIRRKAPQRVSKVISEASAETQVRRNFSSTRFPQRRRSSNQSQSTVLSQEFLQPIEALQKFEEEELESRRRHIENIKSRRKAGCSQSKEGVSSLTLQPSRNQSSSNLTSNVSEIPRSEQKNYSKQCPRKSFEWTQDEQAMIANLLECRKEKYQLSCVTNQGDSACISNAPLVPAEDIEETLDHLDSQDSNVNTVVSASPLLTDEDIYNHHLQAYIQSVIFGEDIGDLQYCDDDDFLYHDPDEVIEDASQETLPEKQSIPIFEFSVSVCDGESLNCDDCMSEVTGPYIE